LRVDLAYEVLGLSRRLVQRDWLLASIRGRRHQSLQIQAWILKRGRQWLLRYGLRHLQHAILILRTLYHLLYLPSRSADGVQLLLIVLGNHLYLLDGLRRGGDLLDRLRLRHQVWTLEGLELGQIIERAEDLGITRRGNSVSH
jgi:hypothetical protein